MKTFGLLLPSQPEDDLLNFYFGGKLLPVERACLNVVIN